MSFFRFLLPAAVLLMGLAACDQDKPAQQPAQQTPAEQKPVKVTPAINYTIVKKHPHDVTMFTEEYLPQTRSVFGIVNLETGKVDVKGELDKEKYFGEGIVFVKDKLYQVTYTNQLGFIYDAKTFKPMGQFGYQNKQGWGLTTEGTSIIMSDGTNYLTYFDPVDFHIIKVLGITENDFALDYINELEYINGFIYANVWMKNDIVKIDPSTGEVVGKMNLSAIFDEVKRANPNSLEMNGIAYDPATDKILITGKLWPNMYEIKFDH
jgi:glutamine cyclotransferase